MLRRIFSKVLAVDQALLPTPALMRCSLASSTSPSYIGYVDEERDYDTWNKSGFCQVNMLGRVACKPKEITTQDGHSVVSFLLGFQDDTRKKDASTDKRQWLQIHVIQEPLQKSILKRVNVGTSLIVLGNLVYTVDPADGDKKTYVINSEKITVLNNSKKNLEGLLAYKDHGYVV